MKNSEEKSNGENSVKRERREKFKGGIESVSVEGPSVCY